MLLLRNANILMRYIELQVKNMLISGEGKVIYSKAFKIRKKKGDAAISGNKPRCQWSRKKRKNLEVLKDCYATSAT